MSNRPSTEASAVPTDAEHIETPAAIKLRRRVHVNITGTMNQFHSIGSQAATWKPYENKLVEIFGVNDADGVCLDPATMSNALRSAVVSKVVVHESSSSFPVPLGVCISGIPNEEMTDSGEKFACTVLPNSSTHVPQVVYQTDASSEESIEWRNKYPNYNASNLETWGVLNVQKCPFAFVHKDHPAIDLLRVNKDILGADIDEVGLIDEQWHKVSRQVLSTCCNMIRNKVLSRVSTTDLNNFSIQLLPLNGLGWADFGSGSEIVNHMPINTQWTHSEIEKAETTFAELQKQKVCSYMARLEIEYEIQP